jgi:hypothetical protein
VTAFTASTMDSATQLVFGALWFGLLLGDALRHVRGLVRGWRYRRYVRTRADVFAEYGLFHVGSPPGARP